MWTKEPVLSGEQTGFRTDDHTEVQLGVYRKGRLLGEVVTGSRPWGWDRSLASVLPRGRVVRPSVPPLLHQSENGGSLVGKSLAGPGRTVHVRR